MARTQYGHFILGIYDERWIVMVRVKEHLQEKTGFTLQYKGFSQFKTNHGKYLVVLHHFRISEEEYLQRAFHNFQSGSPT